MSDHPRIQARLQADLDGQIPAAGHAWVTEHLAAHPAEAEAQRERAAMADRLRASLAPGPAYLDDDRREAIRQAATMPPPRIIRPRLWHLMLAAAALILAIGGAVMAVKSHAEPIVSEMPAVRIASVSAEREVPGRVDPVSLVPPKSPMDSSVQWRQVIDDSNDNSRGEPVKILDLPVRSVQSDEADSDNPQPRGREEAIADRDMGGMGAWMAVGAGGGIADQKEHARRKADMPARSSAGWRGIGSPSPAPSSGVGLGFTAQADGKIGIPAQRDEGRIEKLRVITSEDKDVTRKTATLDQLDLTAARPVPPQSRALPGPAIQPASPKPMPQSPLAERGTTAGEGLTADGTKGPTYTYQRAVGRLAQGGPDLIPTTPQPVTDLWQQPGLPVDGEQVTRLDLLASAARNQALNLNGRLNESDGDRIIKDAGGKQERKQLVAGGRVDMGSVHTKGAVQFRYNRSQITAARDQQRQLIIRNGQSELRLPQPMDATDLGGLDAATFTSTWNAVPMLPVAVRADQTFAFNADTALFQQVVSQIQRKVMPSPEQVRPEQFINAVPADHPAPSEEPVALYAEAALHPLLADDRTLLVAVTAVTRAPRPEERRPLNLVVCLDASGSMAAPGSLDRAGEELAGLVGRLVPGDRISVVTFSDRARVLVPTVQRDFASVSRAIAGITPQATTNAVEGLRLAYQIAADGADPGRESVVLLVTDGATLVPAAVDDAVVALGAYRGRGIQLLAAVVGEEPPQPLAIQRLAERADGRVLAMDKPLSAQLVPGRLSALVADAKCQVVWNPERVSYARLVGYREHRLKAEDFRNDAIDAAEIAADTRVTALFEIIPVEGGSGPYGTARVRFNDLRQRRIVEQALPLGGTILRSRPSDQLRLWAVAAATGEWLERGWWSNTRAWDANRLCAGLGPIQDSRLKNHAALLRGMITNAQGLFK